MRRALAQRFRHPFWVRPGCMAMVGRQTKRAPARTVHHSKRLESASRHYTLQENGEFNVKGSFQTVQEEWNIMSASITYSSKLSAVQIHFLSYGGIVVVIMVLGCYMFYLKNMYKKTVIHEYSINK